MKKTVTLSREQYTLLKKHQHIDHALLKQLVASLEDIKQGRVKRVR